MGCCKSVTSHSQNKSKALKEIKEELNLVINSDADFSDFIAIDHDYVLPEGLDCLIYYSSGILCKRLQSYIKCEVCRPVFLSVKNERDPLMANQPLAILATEDDLIHPSTKLYNLIKLMNNLFFNIVHIKMVTISPL